MSTVQAKRPRRRVRVARAVLARVQRQRDALATAYGAASSPQDRFNAAAHALRSAAAERHQRDNPATTRRLDMLTEQVMRLVDELHAEQEQRARRALRADDRRLERNERNRHERITHHTVG